MISKCFIELPRVAVAVAVGEAPLQLLVRQRAEVKPILIVDAAAYDFNNPLCHFGFHVASFHHIHPEPLLDAGEVEVLTLKFPAAGTDIVEHIGYHASICKRDRIHLPGGVQGCAVRVEVHDAGLVHIEVVSIEIVLKGVLVGVVAGNILRRGVLCHTARSRDNQIRRNYKTNSKQTS